jgi:hypothetical protein
MKIQSVLLLCSLVLAACSLTSQPDETVLEPPGSGVEGIAVIGPMCPVVQENVPCPDEPFQGTFTILTAEGGRVTEFQTDEQGRFRVSLAAGEFVLRLESPKPMRGAKDIQFSVADGRYTALEIKIDSGIR